MDKLTIPSTVKELFAPLGVRLYEFETGRYLKTAIRYESMYPVLCGLPDKSFIVYKIGQLANRFNPQEVYDEAKPYVDRIKAALDNLEPVEYEFIEDEDVAKDPNDTQDNSRVTTEEQKKEWMELFQHELSTFLKDLEAILKVRETMIENSATSGEKKQVPANIQQSVIQLPENFTVTQLNKHFNPQLSLNQAALFLHYLREQAVLPPYSDSSIGKLAEAFFVRNQKNITTSLTNIHSVKQGKEDLTALKHVLEKLLHEIETDLKKAR